MSKVIDVSDVMASAAGPRWGWSLVATLRHGLARLNARREQRLAAAHLEAMGDRELKDIGLSRSDIAFAVTRGTAPDPTTRRYS
jgi:uncharacterized protein YjiS (DUF1127 family)